MVRIIILFVFLFPFVIQGQNSLYLTFSGENENYYSAKKITQHDSKEDVDKYLQKLRSKYIRKGYVLASIDSIKSKNDTVEVVFYIGTQFKEINISYDEKDEFIIRKTPRISEKLLAKLPFDPEMVDQALGGITRYLNSNGYPFSKTYLKVEEIGTGLTTAHLHIEKGPLVSITKIHIRGESKVRSKFVQNAISIKEGDLYNSSVLRNISSKIAQVQFLREIRPYEMLFTEEGAELYLYVESIPVSLINGIVGLQPDAVTGKTTVTGDVRLKLLNILRFGEELQINWKSLQPKTQELKIDFNLPFLFNSPFGIDAKFNLYKLDSTYLQINFHAGVRYYFSGGNYLKAFYEADNSNLLSGATSLPNSNFSSITSNNYGLGYSHAKIDYLPNPSKGFNIQVSASIGRRKSRPANDSDTTIVSTVLKGNIDIEAFIPITPRHVIRLANHSRSYFAPKIYQNELFRFGGLNMQRGFNEESLFATTLTTFSVEYRFLVDRDSHAFAFFDQSIYEDNANHYEKDTPFGFGVGYSFGTKLGIFSISYAMGKQFDNPIKMKDGKVHFGYIAYF